ncbi:uncharacterized protein FIBRA_00158 [Fibroporia radiculosa]|uniref:FAS1 domain-containing protein n=1 Tax=Fibroporia radiculosa TaxID=599839 RepID=J7S5R2_9APHY|nr:uncharacterized protein FIBRA_00158 [Fibroporia radiculosa]CCL98164.1 predicted protein [Fibroporia radiculosa]
MRLPSLFSQLPLLLLPLLAHAAHDDQLPLDSPAHIMRPTSSGDHQDYTYKPTTYSQPTLADLLTIEPRASIFFSYARETAALSTLFADVNGRSTVLVPTNRAVMALARKPRLGADMFSSMDRHQGPTPPDSGVILPEAEFDTLSRENVERWVSAHIIPKSPISLLDPPTHATLLAGKNVSFRFVGGDEGAGEWARVRLEDDVRLVDMKEAVNGVIYVIDGTVKLD